MKQVQVYLSRSLTVARKGHDTVKLPAGKNTLDDTLANHFLVKAHTLSGAPGVVDNAALELAEARVGAADARANDLAESLNASSAKIAELTARAELAEANAANLAELTARAEADAVAFKFAADELQKQLDAKTGELAAMVAAFNDVPKKK